MEVNSDSFCRFNRLANSSHPYAYVYRRYGAASARTLHGSIALTTRQRVITIAPVLVNYILEMWELAPSQYKPLASFYERGVISSEVVRQLLYYMSATRYIVTSSVGFHIDITFTGTDAQTSPVVSCG